MAQISLNNGNTYMTAAEAIRLIYVEDEDRAIGYNGGWEGIVNAMDDDTREAVNGMDLDYNDDERHDNELFLAAYLERATDDLIVG